MTSLGVKPTTFWLVAQHPNHPYYRVHILNWEIYKRINKMYTMFSSSKSNLVLLIFSFVNPMNSYSILFITLVSWRCKAFSYISLQRFIILQAASKLTQLHDAQSGVTGNSDSMHRSSLAAVGDPLHIEDGTFSGLYELYL
jgi:hypothetical protein